MFTIVLPLCGKRQSNICQSRIKSGSVVLNYRNCAEKMGYQMLPITDKHVGALETLVFHNEHQVNNDPFDRIMIAQAKADGITFVTHDSKIPFYNESCVIAV